MIQYRNAVQQDSMFGEARLKLAEAYESLGDVNNARAEYVRAADLLPSNPDVQVRTASYLLLARRFEDAEARADKALAVAPNNVEAQIVKGNALAGLKDLDAAVAEIEGAIRENPDARRQLWNLGALRLARAIAIRPRQHSRKPLKRRPRRCAHARAGKLLEYGQSSGGRAQAEGGGSDRSEGHRGESRARRVLLRDEPRV